MLWKDYFKVICSPLPSVPPAPEHLSFPLGSPLACIILPQISLGWEQIKPLAPVSPPPPPWAPPVQLRPCRSYSISSVSCIMQHVPSSKWKCLSEQRFRVRGIWQLSRGGAVWPRFNQNKPLYYYEYSQPADSQYFAPIFSIYSWILGFHIQYCFIMVEKVNFYFQ